MAGLEKPTKGKIIIKGKWVDNSQYERVQVKVNRIEDVESVQDTIKAMGHQTYSLTDILTSMKETSRMIQMIREGSAPSVILFPWDSTASVPALWDRTVSLKCL